MQLNKTKLSKSWLWFLLHVLQLATDELFFSLSCLKIASKEIEITYHLDSQTYL